MKLHRQPDCVAAFIILMFLCRSTRRRRTRLYILLFLWSPSIQLSQSKQTRFYGSLDSIKKKIYIQSHNRKNGYYTADMRKLPSFTLNNSCDITAANTRTCRFINDSDYYYYIIRLRIRPTYTTTATTTTSM